MVNDINQIKFMRKAFLPVLPLVYDDALSYIEFLGKVCEKCNEIIEAMNNMEAIVLDEAKSYTDGKLDEVYRSLESTVETVNREINDLLAENARFEQRIVSDVNDLEREIDNFNNVLIANTKAINERTDLVVQENNTYLLNQMREYLADILVVNYITGEDMSIQDMFNYLCMYHLTDPITYTELAGKECTYTTLVSYDMTYTQLVTNGGTIIE